MRKPLILLSLIAVLFSSVARADVFPDISEIKKRGVLRVALTHQDSPPFYMKDRDGKLFGIDIALAEEIAKDLKVKIEYDRTSKTHDDSVDLVLKKKVDVALGKLSANLNRDEKILFTNPYVNIKHTVILNISRTAGKYYEKFEDLVPLLNTSATSIGVSKGSLHASLVKEDFPNAKIVEFANNQDLLQAITDGKVKVAFTSETNAKNYLYFHPEKSTKIQFVSKEGSASNISIGLSGDRRFLRDWLNLEIATMETNGKLDKLKKEYLEDYAWTKRIE